jgi:6-phosphogluconolactonase (cycloisomerase 2 family)
MQRDVARTSRLVLLALAAVALLVPATAVARKHTRSHHGRDHRGGHRIVGAVYTTTNDPAGNAVVAYARHADGTITKVQTVNTGGTGIAAQPPFGFPIIDASGSTNLTPDGRLLFVANDGDNSISSFRITPFGPRLVENVTSGGILPVSLTTRGNLLYVVNEESGSIFGYRFSNSGHLQPIAHSERALSTVGPDASAADIGFSPNGRQLIVTLRGLPATHGTIDTFGVNSDGTTGPAVASPADSANPFAFAFAGSRLIVSNVGFVATGVNVSPNPLDPTQFNGSASSYTLSPSGTVTSVSNVASNARAACWVVITHDQRYAFVVNTLSDSVADIGTGKQAISRYSIAPNGTLTLLGNTDATGPGFPDDEALSNDGRFLYVLNAFLMGGVSHIDVYRVGPGGSLTHIQETPSELPNGVSGIGVF